MKITRFPAIPDFLLERFVPFDAEFNGRNWEEFYSAVCHLKNAYPDHKFRDKPYLYVDLQNMTSGYLFLDAQSNEVFYVHNP